MKKSLLLITSNLAPYRVQWCEKLSDYYQVSIVYTKDHDFERDDQWLVRSSKKCNLIKLNNRFNNDRNPLCFDVIKELKKERDYIIFDGYGPITNLLGMYYLKLHKKIFYVNVDGWAKGITESRFATFIKKIIFKGNYKFLCSSSATKEYLLNYGIKEQRVYIHNFSSIHDKDIVLINQLAELKEKVRNELNFTGKNVLSVGRFMEIKAFEDFLLSKKYLEEKCNYYLVGGKPPENYLKIINDHSLDNIHFIDLVDKNKLDKYYLAADIFVLPTKSDVWGLVINEAMAKGLPIITTKNCVAGLSLVEEGVNGYTIDVGDVKDLAKKIDFLLKNDTIRENYAKGSLLKIKNYTIENMAQTHYRILENKLKESGEK